MILSSGAAIFVMTGLRLDSSYALSRDALWDPMVDGRIESLLAGRRVMLVEDDYFLAQEMVRIFEASGATVLGPAPCLVEALALIAHDDRIDCAVLDINLLGVLVYPAADALMVRGVPFVFATAYGPRQIPARFRHIKRCEKPVEPEMIARELFAQAGDHTA